MAGWCAEVPINLSLSPASSEESHHFMFSQQLNMAIQSQGCVPALVPLTMAKRLPLDGCTCLSFPVLHHGLIAMQNAHAAFSIQQGVAMSFFPRFCSHGSIHSSVVGGWSMGGNLTFCSVLELEVCCCELLAVFALDCRSGLSKHSRRAAISDDQRTGGGQWSRVE